MLSNQRSMRSLIIIGILLSSVFSLGVLAQSNEPLTNSKIIEMVKENLDESFILRSIETSEINFDISPAGLIQLKRGKVKNRIIAVIQNAQIRKNELEAASRKSESGGIIGSIGKPEPTLTPQPTPEPKPVASQDIEFFTIDIERCSISGSAVICYFKITNNGTERHVGFLKDFSEVVDYMSKTSKAKDYKFGNASNERATGWKPIGPEPTPYLPADILPKGSARGWVRFDGVAPDTQKLGKLIIGFSITGGNSFSVPFRDVPVEKSNIRSVHIIN